jgi:hypothetical protein
MAVTEIENSLRSIRSEATQLEVQLNLNSNPAMAVSLLSRDEVRP